MQCGVVEVLRVLPRPFFMLLVKDLRRDDLGYMSGLFSTILGCHCIGATEEVTEKNASKVDQIGGNPGSQPDAFLASLPK